MLLDHQVGWPSMWFLGQLDESPASSRAHPPGWRIMRFHGELNNKKPQKHSKQRNILRNHWSFRAILNGILSDGSPKHNHCIAMNRTCRFDTFSICKTLWKSPRRKFPNHINHPGIDREPFISFNLFSFSFALFRIVSIPSSNNNSVGFCTLFSSGNPWFSRQFLARVAVLDGAVVTFRNASKLTQNNPPINGWKFSLK